MGSFKRTRAGIGVTLDPVEVAVLGQVIGEVFDVIGPLADPGETPGSTDGGRWARDLGLGGVGESEQSGFRAAVPDDPVSARLFPDAYRDDDEAAGDFRRFTEGELRAVKSANAEALLASLPEGGGTAVLDEETTAAWLGALNDARLALGTALDVDENTSYELATLEVDDPRAQRLLVYLWLGELQDSLLVVLTGD